MANETTATLVGGYGQGDTTVRAFHAGGRPLGMIGLFCALFEVSDGEDNAIIKKQNATAKTVASASEADAAAAYQAFGALGSVTLTPASYTAAWAPTTEAFHAVDTSIVDLELLGRDEIVYPHKRVLSYDASIGVVKYLFTQLGNAGGASGTDYTPRQLITDYKDLCENLGQMVDVIAWLSLGQWAQLVKYGLGTAASLLGTEWGVNKLLVDMLKFQGYDISGYRTSIGPIHIFMDPDPNGFGVVGADRCGAMFVPAAGGLNGRPLPEGAEGRFASMQRDLPGGLPIAPAFGIAFRDNPIEAPARIGLAPDQMRRIVTPEGITVVAANRSYAGQNIGIVDTWSFQAAAILNDNSGLQILSNV